MRIRAWILAPIVVLTVGLLGSCAGQQSRIEQRGLRTAQREEVEQEVRSFLLSVAQDVTREGPPAWKKEFAEGREFFMASEGKLAFGDGRAAAKGIDAVAKLIKRMELRWGEDLKIDVLTPELAVVGTSWQETQENREGYVVNERGYFTGVTEKQDGRWVFRDVHWSVVPPENGK